METLREVLTELGLARVRTYIQSGSVRVTENERLSVIFLPASVPRDLALPYKSSKGDFELIGAGATEVFAVWHVVNGTLRNSA